MAKPQPYHGSDQFQIEIHPDISHCPLLTNPPFFPKVPKTHSLLQHCQVLQSPPRAAFTRPDPPLSARHSPLQQRQPLQALLLFQSPCRHPPSGSPQGPCPRSCAGAHRLAPCSSVSAALASSPDPRLARGGPTLTPLTPLTLLSVPRTAPRAAALTAKRMPTCCSEDSNSSQHLHLI